MRGPFDDITCYLFDLDGTLIDSSHLHENAYRQTLRKQCPELLKAFDYSAIAGLTTQFAFRQLGLNEAATVQATATKQALYRKMIDNGLSKAFAGAVDLLSHLSRAGAAIAVVTSAKRASAERVLGLCELSPFVDIVVAGEDSLENKPKPMPFVIALERLKKSAKHSIVVEDAISGIQAARAAGLKVVGVHQNSIKDLVDYYFADLQAFAKALK